MLKKKFSKIFILFFVYILENIFKYRIKIRNVPVVELDTIKASDAFGPGSSPGGHTKINTNFT